MRIVSSIFCFFLFLGASCAANAVDMQSLIGVKPTAYTEEALLQFAKSQQALGIPGKIGRDEYQKIKAKSFKGMKPKKWADRLLSGAGVASASSGGYLDDCHTSDCWAPNPIIDLGPFGSWEYGYYMEDRGFWEWLVADAWALRREEIERIPQCRAKFDRCITTNRIFKSGAMTACGGLAGLSFVAGGICAVVVELGTDQAQEECFEDYADCVNQ
jgi:hypothetical protein